MGQHPGYMAAEERSGSRHASTEGECEAGGRSGQGANRSEYDGLFSGS